MRTALHHGRGIWCPALAMTALVAVFTITGCALETESTAHNPETGTTGTIFMALGACESDLACADVDYEALGLTHLESCLACSCAPSPEDPETDTIQLSFLASCMSELGCVTDLDCSTLADACNTASCVATECVIIPIEDPSPDDAGECELRSCDPATGWGNTPEVMGAPCDDGDSCTTASSCDGAGVCLAEPDSNECCMAPADCESYCADIGGFPACVDFGSEDGFFRCGCFPATDVEFECGNGSDDDLDGDVDCADADCSDTEFCSGDEPTGSCCEAHGGISCLAPVDADGPEGVCALNAECCVTEWNSTCVEIYVGLNPGVCEPVATCGDGIDCTDPACDGDPACPDSVEECSNGVDDDGDGLTDCADPDCTPCEEEPTEATLLLNAGWYFQGCTGPPMSAPSYVGCSGGWSSNAGQSLSWDPATENALFTIRNEGGLWPLQAVNCATDEFTLVGATTSDIFVDSAAPAALGCTPVCTDPDGDGTPNAPNWVCTGVPAP